MLNSKSMLPSCFLSPSHKPHSHLVCSWVFVCNRCEHEQGGPLLSPPLHLVPLELILVLTTTLRRNDELCSWPDPALKMIFISYLSLKVKGMSANICMVSMVKAAQDQVCDCLVSESKLHCPGLPRKGCVCDLRQSRRSASGNCLKFHKFRVSATWHEREHGLFGHLKTSFYKNEMFLLLNQKYHPVTPGSFG